MKELQTTRFFVAEDIIEILSREDVRKITKRIYKGEFLLRELNELLYTFVTEGYIGRKTFLEFIRKLEEVYAYIKEQNVLIAKARM